MYILWGTNTNGSYYSLIILIFSEMLNLKTWVIQTTFVNEINQTRSVSKQWFVQFVQLDIISSVVSPNEARADIWFGLFVYDHIIVCCHMNYFFGIFFEAWMLRSICSCMEKISSTFFEMSPFVFGRRKKVGFGMTWGWVNDDRIFICG